MDNRNHTSSPWRLSPQTRTKLTQLLREGAADATSPALTLTQAITALEEIRSAYLRGEELAARRKAPTPASTSKLIERVLTALRQLEARADSDTVRLMQEHAQPIRQALQDRLDVFAAWDAARKMHIGDSEGRPVRKVDGRGERKRILCGYIAKVWANAACEPDNLASRRRFAMAFLDAAGIDHPGANHPNRLDDWLGTPVDPLSMADHEAAADQARNVLVTPPPS